ncbi:sensor histidine kinase [Maribacter cobaltidurans]|uniref:histidine kinase n=1 Tax=Maribacter cobaltidurans TaxID=1178778 RepID=A0A223V9W8_9FLAO|nr:PAS domain-containing sensor histidine kinase [Maribacter cobaltidurans]ASV32171.1 hypothetical protein CJ263_19165 [Maribacter cobaltidurans]GGD91203.1 hypothetical protein GCM10011412_31450 [Maribacter cobaltidurans]
MEKEKKTMAPTPSVDNPLNDFKQLYSHGDIYQQIFKYAVIPILVHDIEMNILNANDSAVEMFGYSHKELLEKSVLDLHTEDEIDHSGEVLEKIKHVTKLSVETSFKRKDGSVFKAEATPCKYILDGQPLVHVFIKDITPRKLAERKLKETNQALLTQMAQVKRYTKEIESKNKELADFSYVSAHDLKAPVTNIVTLSNMISVDAITDEYDREVFGKLRKNVEILSKKVNALNDIINFKATLAYKNERLNFAQIFVELKESIAQQLDEANATISEDFSEAPEIDYPSLHLKSIMQNLLTNAVKYKDPNKPLILEVKTTKEKGNVILSVKDNGIGFDSAKYKEKIFGLFRRLHTGINGMGVGMYIVKSIVDSHDGKIEVESKPGLGALFRIHFKTNIHE